LDLPLTRFNRVDVMLVLLFIAVLIFTDKQEPQSAPPAWWEAVATYVCLRLLALMITPLYLSTVSFSAVLRLAYAAVAVLCVLVAIKMAFLIRLAVDEREAKSWRKSLYTSEISISNTMGFENPKSATFAWINQREKKLNLTLVRKNPAQASDSTLNIMYQLELFKPPCMTNELRLQIDNINYGTSEFLEVLGTQTNPTLAQVKMKDNSLILGISAANVELGCNVSGDPREFYFGIFDPR
jgi:hypothetical protein